MLFTSPGCLYTPASQRLTLSRKKALWKIPCQSQESLDLCHQKVLVTLFLLALPSFSGKVNLKSVSGAEQDRLPVPENAGVMAKMEESEPKQGKEGIPVGIT